jgi:diguanylate cyclase (GGDEF)-like protein
MSIESSSYIPFEGRCDAGNPCRYGELVNQLQQQIITLKEQAQTDALTGLYNYRFFADALPREMERAHRSFQPVSLIMIDIDRFKKLNDQRGHEAGNQVLIHVSKIIKQTIRKLDIACRFGGEEFAVILPNTDLRHSIAVAKRVREAIENSALNLPADSINVTASLGVDEYRPHHSDSMEAFIERVDTHLYEAKKTGRNRVKYPEAEENKFIHTHVSADEKDALFGIFSYPESSNK